METNLFAIITKLMHENHIKNYSELSRLTGIPITTISKIKETGGANTKLSTLIKFANFFNISLDQLVGRNIHQQQHDNKQALLITIDKLVKDLLEEY